MTDDDAGRHDRHRDGRQAASAKAPTKPRVFYDVGYLDTTGQIYGPAEGSFLAEMVGLLGVDMITGDKVDLRGPARDAHRARSRRSSSWASTRSTRRRPRQSPSGPAGRSDARSRPATSGP